MVDTFDSAISPENARPFRAPSQNPPKRPAVNRDEVASTVGMTARMIPHHIRIAGGEINIKYAIVLATS